MKKLAKRRLSINAEPIRTLSTCEVEVVASGVSRLPSKPCTSGGCHSAGGGCSGYCSYEC